MMVSKFASCAEVLHPWSTSCTFVTAEMFYNIFRRSFKIYGSLYLIAAIFRRKKLEYFKKKLLAETLRSTVFLSLNGSLFAACICRVRYLLGQFTYFSSGFIPGLISSYIAILVERPQRRGLLALYMFNNAVEAVFNTLVDKSIITSIPYGEVYMFCVATAILMYLYRKRRLNNEFLDNVLGFLFGKKENSKLTSFEDVYNSLGFKRILNRIIQPLQAFSLGYLIQVIPGLMRSILQPSRIPRVLVSRNNFKLGLFFGSFVGLFQLVEFLLELIRKKQDSLNSLMAGAISGSSLLFYRSSTISLYVFTKVAEMLFRDGQSQGVLPVIPYADIIIYIISSAITFHVCLFDCKNVRASYFNFLNHISCNRILPASKIFPLIHVG